MCVCVHVSSKRNGVRKSESVRAPTHTQALVHGMVKLLIIDFPKSKQNIFFVLPRSWWLSCRKLTMQTGEGEIVDTSHIEAQGFGFIKPDTGETCDGG